MTFSTGQLPRVPHTQHTHTHTQPSQGTTYTHTAISHAIGSRLSRPRNPCCTTSHPFLPRAICTCQQLPPVTPSQPSPSSSPSPSPSPSSCAGYHELHLSRPLPPSPPFSPHSTHCTKAHIAPLISFPLLSSALFSLLSYPLLPCERRGRLRRRVAGEGERGGKGGALSSVALEYLWRKRAMKSGEVTSSWFSTGSNASDSPSSNSTAYLPGENF